MGEHTEIAWTDHTFNPWWGCQRVSPGCEHCYAESFSKRVGLKVWGPQTERRFFGDAHWAEPLKWNAKAARDGVRRRVFCASMADVFEDRDDLLGARSRLGDLIEATPSLDWLLLTKRPENMMRFARRDMWTTEEWPANVWAGTTVEDQKRANERILELLRVPARVRFLSCEPLLEAVNLGLIGTIPKDIEPGYTLLYERIHWVIVGGESGPGARPFDLAWARAIRNECAEVGVACFVKQMGADPIDGHAGLSVPFRDRKGADWSEWPSDLRVRRFPEACP